MHVTTPTRTEHFCGVHLAYLRAPEGSQEEKEALTERDNLLATFTPAEFSDAIATSIGMQNILVRIRDTLPVVTTRTEAAA